MNRLVPNRSTDSKWAIAHSALCWYFHSGKTYFFYYCFIVFLLFFLLRLLLTFNLFLALLFILLNFAMSILFMHLHNLSSLGLHVERFTVHALVNTWVLQNVPMAVNGAIFYSNKQTNIKVNCQTQEWFYDSAVSACHLAYHLENHPQSHLVAVFLWKRDTTVFVRAHVWSSGTEYCHVSESHAHQSSILKTVKRRLQEWNSRAIWI